MGGMGGGWVSGLERAWGDEWWGVEGGDGGVGRERERSAERLGSPLGAPVCGSGVAMCRCARVSLCLWDGVQTRSG